MIKNIRIRTRLLLSYGVIIFLCLFASIAALVLLNRIGDNLTSFYDNNYTVTVNVAAAQREMQSARGDLLGAILETDPEITAEMIETAGDSLASMRAAFPVIHSVFKGDIALVEEAEAILKEAIVYRDQVFELTLAGDKEKAFEVMNLAYVPLLNKMTVQLQTIADIAGQNALKMVQQGKYAQEMAIVIVSVIIVLSLLFAWIIGLFISNTVRRPINEIEKATLKLADGELEAAQVNYSSKDELGILSDNIRSLIDSQKKIIFDIAYVLGELSKGDFTVSSHTPEAYKGNYGELLASVQSLTLNLNRTLQRINNAADQVADEGTQISAGSQAIAQGATEQACSVEELASFVTDISAQMKITAANAEEAREQTIQAGSSVADCKKQMEDMVAAMDDINHKSSEIKRIIKVIEDIALQTNILSLNASVEAARAGTAAQGFSVVANEVRSLAGKSAKASKETAALIEGSLQAVQKGIGIAGQTAHSLLLVVQNTQAAASTVDGIADAARQQVFSISQAKQGIEQISSVVQNNTATSEESAAASEELSAQAQVLKDLVSEFKLGRSTDGTNPYSISAPFPRLPSR